MKHSINLRVNGQTYPLDVEPRERLLDVVRYKLDVTGPKEGCGTGDVNLQVHHGWYERGLMP